MRAPRWFRNFSEWRWAPCVALIVGSLVFIALALLLIPMRFDAPTRVATEHSEEALSVPVQRTLSAASPAPVVTAEAPSPAAVTTRRLALPVPLTPSAIPTEPSAIAREEIPAASPQAPDFRANIADRGDRPGAARSETREHE